MTQLDYGSMEQFASAEPTRCRASMMTANVKTIYLKKAEKIFAPNLSFMFLKQSKI